MNILFAASECAPLAKVGGLADVIGSLPKALNSLGIDVRIALPKYDVIDDKKFPSDEFGSFVVPFNGKNQSIMVRHIKLPDSNGVPVYLLDHPTYFGNGGVYIEADASSGGSNAELNRFGLFSRAIPELIQMLGWYPDIIHCHDWQTGAVPVLYRNVRANSRSPVQNIKTLFTIHNLAYQGIHPRSHIEHAFGNDIASALTQHPQHPNAINFLASALSSAYRVSTVSPTYAQEISTKENGHGLEMLLKNLPHPPVGILNGIDTDYWNPATDQFLLPMDKNIRPFTFAIKAEVKRHLQKKLLLKIASETPLFVMVSRLTEQKGFDILIPALRTLLPAHEFQCVILATGDKRYASELHKLAKEYPEKLHFTERFDEPLAHLMYAAGDFFLMPSRFEPCGLGQMIAMRYGTIPIATAVGGLKDTVKDGDTGFVVSLYDSDTLIGAIERALYRYGENPAVITQLQKKGMNRDLSWKHSAQKYVKLYLSIITQ